MNAKEVLLLLLLSCCLISFAVFSVVGCRLQATASSKTDSNFWVCVDGKTKFTKEFFGNVGSINGNITITDVSGKVWFNGPLPVGNKIILVDVPQGLKLMIEWKDWRGVQQEPYIVSYSDCGDYLKNFIPYPPTSAQTQQNF